MTIENPYPGLRPFDEADAHLFFGRKAAIRELLELLQRHRFLAVLGLSGSGKSSLVRAGLLPALHLGAMGEEFADWRVAMFQPGMDPIGALSAALDDPKVLGPDPDGRALLDRGLGLAERALRASLPDGSYLLIVVDQFEELFRFQKERAHGANDAPLFVRLLLEASQTEWSRVHVLITMRSDFLGECAQFAGFPEALKQGQYLVKGMTVDERREAIEQPARLAQVELESGLVQRVLDDAGDDPARLPVMQHALMRTCEEGKPGPLTVEHYQTAGTMTHALDWHAQKIYGHLTERDRLVARRMFQCLAARRAGARDTRRPTTVKQLAHVAGVSEDSIRAIYGQFSGSNRTFLTFRQPHGAKPVCASATDSTEMLTSDTLIDVTHESLLHSWKELNKWIDQEEECGRRFVSFAEEVVNHPDDVLDGSYLARARDWLTDVLKDFPSGLSEEKRLAALEAWARRYPVRQGETETPVTFAAVKDLIDKSAASEAERQDRRKQQERRERVVRQAMAMLLLLAVFLGLGFWRSTVQTREVEALNDQLKTSADDLKEETRAKEQALELAKNDAQAARDAKSKAEDALNEAESLRENAQRQRDVAEKLRRNEQLAREAREQALADTEKALKDANTAREAARVAAARADDERRDAELARENADKQRRIAVSRVLFATSESLRARERASLWPTSLAVGLAAIQLAGSDAALVNQAAQSWTLALNRLPRQAYGTRLPLTEQERLLELATTPAADMLALLTVVSNKASIRVVDRGGTRIKDLPLEGSLSKLSFSPDGDYLAGIAGNRALLWSTKTWTMVPLPHTTPDDNVLALTFAPDSRTLATGGSDQFACIWRTSDGSKLRCLHHPGTEYVIALDFTSDGQRLLTGTDEKYARIWTVHNGQQVTEMLHTDIVNAVRFSPDGKIAATASGSRVRLWPSTDGKLPVATLAHPGPISQIAFSTSGRLATASSDNIVRLWSTMTGGLVASLTHENRINAITFSPDGRYVATASADNTGRVWEIRGAETWRAIHDGGVLAIRFTPDGRYFVTASSDRMARTWEMPRGPEAVWTIEGGTDRAAFGGQDRLTILGSDRSLRVVDLGQPQQTPLVLRSSSSTAKSTVDDFRRMAFSQDGRYVAAASIERTATIVDVFDLMDKNRSIRVESGVVEAMAVDRRGRYLAVSSGNLARVWDLSNRTPLPYTLQHMDTVNTLAFSQDGEFVASGSDDGYAKVWEVGTGKQMAALRHRGTEYVRALQFSADGIRLATGTDETTVRTWLWREQKEEHQPFRHGDAVVAVSFNGAGTQLASTSDDNTARVWDLTSRAERRFDLASPGRAVRFSSDDQKLTTVTLNGSISTWSLTPVDLVIEACARLPRNLNEVEWQEHIGEVMNYRKLCPTLEATANLQQQ
jgi:WD40 repeat protein